VERISSSSSGIALALAALVAACASTAEDVKKAQESWQGASYEEVLRAWGAPARSTKTPDGRDWHTWVTDSYPQPSSSVGVGVGGMRIGGGGGVGVGVGMGVPVGSPEPPARCERTFIFADGKVAEQVWNGPPSMCAGLKRP
jgi:hypothetical protein